MNADSEFKIAFGRMARTLVYEDTSGTICFAFDISPAADQSKGEWTLHLGERALTQDGKLLEPSAERERLALALERVKEYVLSRGYQLILE